MTRLRAFFQRLLERWANRPRVIDSVFSSQLSIPDSEALQHDNQDLAEQQVLDGGL